MNADKLPEAVVSGVRQSFGYVEGEPATTKRWQTWAGQALDRLARLPPEVWTLPGDWSANAAGLDDALRVEPPQRTACEERDAHKVIAVQLRTAAQSLVKPHDTDAYADDLLNLLPSFGAPASTREMARVDGNATARGPRLSEFLRAVADIYDGGESGAHVCGIESFRLHGWTVGARRGQAAATAAAHQAFENATAVLKRVTGERRPALTAKMVRAYFPDLDANVDLVDAANKRRKRAPTTKHVKQQGTCEKN